MNIATISLVVVGIFFMVAMGYSAYLLHKQE